MLKNIATNATVCIALAIFALIFCGTAAANERLKLALAAFDNREFDTALNTLETLQSEQADRNVLFHLARIQYRTGDFNAAEDTLKTLLAAYPTDADAWYLAGLNHLALVDEVSIFKKLGQAKQSMSAWQTAVDVDPEHINARYAIFAFYASAPGIAGGDLEKATALQSDLAQRNPGFGAMAEALLLSQREDAAATEAAFKEAVRLMDRAGPHFVLAQFYMTQEQWQAAIREIDNFYQKEKRWWDPDVTVAYLIQAQANARLGNTDSARSIANQALAMSPTPQIRTMLEDTLASL